MGATSVSPNCGSTPGGSMFSPDTFADLGLSPPLAQHIEDRLGFKAPTRIQQKAIPVILSGKDVLVKAGTGTGKTLSYLAPIVDYLQACTSRVTRADGTLALVLVPTRELCAQVCSVAEQLVRRFIWLVPGCVMGGENRSKEKARLRKGITLLVATPGRLLDHLKNTTSFRHDRLHWVIFDEADRLLDLGFKKDIQEILSVLDSQMGTLTSLPARQHVLLSATLNEDVNQLATLSLKDPAVIFVEAQDTGADAAQKTKGLLQTVTDIGEMKDNDSRLDYCIPQQLSQKHILVSCRLRLIALLYLIHHKAVSDEACKLVVFFSTCDSVDFHFSLIKNFHWSFKPKEKGSAHVNLFPGGCFRLHGNIDQRERMKSYMEFGKAAPALLLCTDVAARGLDFQDVTCIIQYDPPGEAEDYVHRVGRTARLGRTGEAVLFLQPTEAGYVSELQEHGVILKKLGVGDAWLCGEKECKEGEPNTAQIHPAAVAMHKGLEAFISSRHELRQLAVDAFRSYVRAYAVHRGELKKIFHVRNLHLGHVAKSFGLSDAPSLLEHSSNKVALKRERAELQRRKMKKRRTLDPASE